MSIFSNILDPLDLFKKKSSGGGGGGGASMSPSDEAALMAYFNSNPVFGSEYNRIVTTLGEKRSPAEWLHDHLAAYPNDAVKFREFLNNGGTTPGQEADVPLEQDLLRRTVDDYITPDMAKDPARRAEAQAIVDRYNAGIDAAIGYNRSSLDGSRLQEEYGMAGDTAQRLRDAYLSQATGQKAALDKLNTDRLAALAPLSKERITAADTQASAIAQGLQRTQDEIGAKDALSGFVGGSSGTDANLARAAIGARQNAAGVMGAAKVQNAGDERSIWDATAQGLAGSEYGRLAGYLGADTNEADWRKSYFDNDYVRKQQAALLPSQLEASRIPMLGVADEYGQSGLMRGMNLLNWFSTNPQPPSYTTYQQTASTAGNDLAKLGSGLAGAGSSWLTANKTSNISTPKTTPQTVNVGDDPDTVGVLKWK